MHVILIGRYVTPYPFSEHRLDYPMLKEWTKHMDQLDVIVQSRDGKPRIWQEDNLQVHYAPGGNRFLRNARFLLWALRRIISIHNRNPVDIVNGSDLIGSVVGILLKPWTRAKVIAQLQGEFIRPSPILYSPSRRKLIRTLAIFISKHSDMIRCLYKAAAEQVASLGVSYSQIAVIPSRCDVNVFNCKNFPRFDRVSNRLLYIGSLVKRKGINFLIKALPDIVHKFPSTVLAIAGRGSQEKEIKELVHNMGLDRSVEFLGHIPHNNISSIMQQADLFVFPSLSEATPRAVMEAMAMELPVVATRVGGIHEMIEDGVTGLLVQPGSSQELTEAITWIFKHPEWTKTAGKIARKHVLEHFTLEKHVEQMIAMHQRVLTM